MITPVPRLAWADTLWPYHKQHRQRPALAAPRRQRAGSTLRGAALRRPARGVEAIGCAVVRHALGDHLDFDHCRSAVFDRGPQRTEFEFAEAPAVLDARSFAVGANQLVLQTACVSAGDKETL
eukprot:1564806-Rhodomonas_salina.2